MPMSFVRAEMSFCSRGAFNFAEGESSGVHSILSGMPSSLILASNSLLNSAFSEVDITEGEASIYPFSGAGTRVRVVSVASLLGDPLFDRLLGDEALATDFVDDLEVKATAFLSSL